MRTVPHFVNGACVEEIGHSPVFNPATGEVIAKVPVPSCEFIDDVVEVARSAQERWGQSSLSRRTNILISLRQLRVEHTDELAALITTEHGKTHANAKGEIARALENVEYACGLIEHLKGGFSDQVADGLDVHSTREHELAHRVVGDLVEGDQIDPVCSMRVFSRDALLGVEPDQVTYYFYSEGCRTTFLEGPRPPASPPIELGRRATDE